MKQFLINHLNEKQLKVVLRYYWKIQSFGKTNNLDKLALIYSTDKYGSHFYTPHYAQHLKKYKYKRFNLLEIGVGGYDNTKSGGESLRMWKRFFPFVNLFAIDIFDKSSLQEKRIKIFHGSQIDEVFLNNVVKEIGDIDVIIDDGSHINEHVIKTFNILFPKLKEGGIYIVEDTQTSYWDDYGGDSERLDNPDTTLNYFKKLTDCLNYVEFPNPNYKPTYFDKHIISMHFYHNLVFIYKGKNNEKSNRIKDNQQ